MWEEEPATGSSNSTSKRIFFYLYCPLKLLPRKGREPFSWEPSLSYHEQNSDLMLRDIGRISLFSVLFIIELLSNPSIWCGLVHMAFQEWWLSAVAFCFAFFCEKYVERPFIRNVLLPTIMLLYSLILEIINFYTFFIIHLLNS